MSFSLIGDVRCLRNSSPASVHRVLEPADTLIDVVLSCVVPFLTALHHVSHSLTCTGRFAMRTRPNIQPVQAAPHPLQEWTVVPMGVAGAKPRGGADALLQGGAG